MGKKSGNNGPDPGEGGRPTKYDPSYNELAYNYSLLGAIDEQLADFLDIGKTTLNRWKIEYPDFRESIKKGKEVADSVAVKSLFKRVTGYEYQEETITTEQIRDKDGNLTGEQLIKKVVHKKQQAPDVAACCYWTKNRQKKLWRDKHDIDLTGKVQVLFDNDDKDLV